MGFLRLAEGVGAWQELAPRVMAFRTAESSTSAFLRISGLLAASLLLVCGQLVASDVPSREFQVKAAFLYNFVQFVEWPPEAFREPDSPIVIGVLGQDPFGAFLDQLVAGETVNGRRLVVERYRWIGEVGTCHMLFISGSEGRRAGQIGAGLKGRSILSVCDWEGLMEQGAMVRFVTERQRVRLRINLDAVRAGGLTISSKLLRSAETVSRETN